MSFFGAVRGKIIISVRSDGVIFQSPLGEMVVSLHICISDYDLTLYFLMGCIQTDSGMSTWLSSVELNSSNCTLLKICE